MRFDQKELKVLSHIHLKADSTVSEVASAVGLKSHTVRYIIESLNERKILQPFMMVNKKSLGFETYMSYFTIKPSFSDKRNEIISDMVLNQICSWVCPVVGDYEYGISLSIKSCNDFHKFNEVLVDKFGSFWGERIFSIDSALYCLGKRYLFGDSYTSEPLVIDSKTSKIDLDDTDLDILKLLMVNPLGSESDLVKKLKIPNSTVNSRIHRMKTSGVISGYIYGINYSKAGISGYRIIADFGGMSHSLFEKFYEFAKIQKNITSFNRCSGNSDLEFIVEFQDSQSISHFMKIFNDHFKDNLSKASVLMLMDDLKWVMF